MLQHCVCSVNSFSPLPFCTLLDPPSPFLLCPPHAHKLKLSLSYTPPPSIPLSAPSFPALKYKSQTGASTHKIRLLPCVHAHTSRAAGREKYPVSAEDFYFFFFLIFSQPWNQIISSRGEENLHLAEVDFFSFSFKGLLDSSWMSSCHGVIIFWFKASQWRSALFKWRLWKQEPCQTAVSVACWEGSGCSGKVSPDTKSCHMSYWWLW